MLLVNLERSSPRARYTVRHVFERMLGWEVAFTGSLEEFRASPLPKLNYGRQLVDGAFHVPASGWMGATGIPTSPPAHRNSGEQLELFPEEGAFDVFAACFFLLGLCQEYTSSERDEHDRTVSSSLLLVRHGAERAPIVDRWVVRLAGELRARFPQLPAPKRKYAHVLTVDVDNGLKYRGRPLHRAIGASMKDLLGSGTGAFRERWRVRSGAATDPYLRFADHLAEAAAHCDRAIAFFLVHGGGRFDHAADLGDPAYRELLRRVAVSAEVGLHPSYESSRRAGSHSEERAKLSGTAGRDVRVSRQHFLRWRLPDTLRTLSDQGFTEEHSMGFSDRIGFRAGTCTPFPWYDLEREQETPLMLHPFATMDSALAEGLGRSPAQAVKEMISMADVVREVNGIFISVWHDRYLSGHHQFAPWPDVMRQLVQHARG